MKENVSIYAFSFIVEGKFERGGKVLVPYSLKKSNFSTQSYPRYQPITTTLESSTISEDIIRSVQCQTGLTVSLIDLCGWQKFRDEFGRKIFIYLRARYRKGELRMNGKYFSGCDWITPENLSLFEVRDFTSLQHYAGTQQFLDGISHPITYLADGRIF
jgi:hypothetical protein